MVVVAAAYVAVVVTFGWESIVVLGAMRGLRAVAVVVVVVGSVVEIEIEIDVVFVVVEIASALWLELELGPVLVVGPATGLVAFVPVTEYSTGLEVVVVVVVEEVVVVEDLVVLAEDLNAAGYEVVAVVFVKTFGLVVEQKADLKLDGFEYTVVVVVVAAAENVVFVS